MKQTFAAQPGITTLGLLYETMLTIVLATIERNDDEALHDFRVALRRLDVLVRQFAQRNEPRKTVLRTLKVLLRQSNQGRDAQVMLAWLRSEWPRLDERERIGARQWQQTLERAQGHRQLEPKQASRELKRMVRPLTKLSPLDAITQEPFGRLLAQQLEQQSNELISLINGEGAEEQLHLIRLKAKTVRYLLLPLCDITPDCIQAEEALRQLQTLLGDWHDTVLRQQSLIDTLRKKYEKRSSDTHVIDTTGHAVHLPPALPGLITLARSNYLTQRQLVARIKHNYLCGGATPHLAALLKKAVSAMRQAATVQG